MRVLRIITGGSPYAINGAGLHASEGAHVHGRLPICQKKPMYRGGPFNATDTAPFSPHCQTVGGGIHVDRYVGALRRRALRLSPTVVFLTDMALHYRTHVTVEGCACKNSEVPHSLMER